ncbi:FAH family protein [Mesorhizobium erdmanii]|uniref:FAH family protein n=2 Tax=Mesorhizobium TaxID=68287 RepID=A0A3M9XB17_9HYPH|nr:MULTISPECIES: AraD1 family protein [Mesorhizobium]RNJ45061.1 FAH family protein [Mesorhizobium japonicum]RXT51864.1 FAH family protein [Mesorhizobium erdmanii]
MRLVQYRMPDGSRRVGRVSDDDNHLHPLDKTGSVLELAEAAIAEDMSIASLVEKRTGTTTVDYNELLRDGRVLAPVDHPEPARFLVTGTGLTHTGSAAARNQMHVLTHGDGAEESDSLKIFRMGLEGGKPGAGKIGIQPEWFFKGVGTCVVPPGAELPMPAFAKAGAEEAEIVGLYLNGPDGHPYRIGYALGNEYSDHVTEGENYLYLAHSKLRSCSIGPELLIGDLPEEVRGHSRILRDGAVIWEQEFLSGEAHMSHSIANLEHFHFRYPMHRRAGDLHAYFFGAAVMSYASGIKTASGDEYEIQAQAFGKPLRNRMVSVPDEGLVTVTQL